MLPQSIAHFNSPQQLNTRRPSLLEEALQYAEHGYHVFPLHNPIFDDTGNCVGCTCEDWRRKQPQYGTNYICPQPGKHPRVRWSEQSTTDFMQIRKWWNRWPNANIGIDCGKSGLLVVDADSYKECYRGDAIELDENTLISVTGGGGAHYWYRQPEGKRYGNGTGTLPAGIDIRGYGGYVVAPPSLHNSSRRYSFRDDHSPEVRSLAPIPATLSSVLDAAQRPSTNERVVLSKKYTPAPALSDFALPNDVMDLIENGAPKGKRSEADWRVVLALAEAGATDEQIHGVFCNYPIGAKYDERGNDYLERTISKARARMENRPTEKLQVLRLWVQSPECPGRLRGHGVRRVTPYVTLLSALADMAMQRRTTRLFTSRRAIALLAGGSDVAVAKKLARLNEHGLISVSTVERNGTKATLVDLSALADELVLRLPLHKECVYGNFRTSSENNFFEDHRVDDAFTSYPYSYARKRRKDSIPLAASLGGTALLLWNALDEGGTVKELAEATGLTEGAVRTALKRLEEAGLLFAYKVGRAYHYELHPDAEARLDERREHMVTTGVGQLRAARIYGEIASFAHKKLTGRLPLVPGEVARLEKQRDDAEAKAQAISDALKKRGINPGKIGKPSNEPPVVTDNLSSLSLEELVELDTVGAPHTPRPNTLRYDDAEE